MNELITDSSLATQLTGFVTNSWFTQSKSVTKFFNKYEDTAYLGEVAPGRNRAVYLLGHLVAASDYLLPLLGLGERMYPELEATFLSNPDKSFETIPTVAELKSYWENLDGILTGHFAGMSPEDWLQRHTRVSEEDFAKDPKRNKLNVLLSRTNHLSYHLGQLTLGHFEF